MGYYAACITLNRTLMLAYVFLARNGYRLTASEAEATRAVLDLAAGSLSEPDFARWLDDHVEPDEQHIQTPWR